MKEIIYKGKKIRLPFEGADYGYEFKPNSENNLDDSSPIHIGTQTWNNSRLKVITGTYNPNASWAINSQLDILPESFGNLTELTGLYLEWHSLTSLPDSFCQ